MKQIKGPFLFWTKMVPTLGASAVVMALQMCDHVSLAGFGYDMQHPEARLHYYEAIRMGAMKAQVSLHWHTDVGKHADSTERYIKSLRIDLSFIPAWKVHLFVA